MKPSQSDRNGEKVEAVSRWAKTPVANMVRYKPSGIYFARVRVRGKLFRQSLKTDVMSVAKLRLNDYIKERQLEMGSEIAVRGGKMSVGDAVRILKQRLDGQQHIKEGAKVYRRKCIEALLRTWPALAEMSANRVSKDACLEWAKNFAASYSASVYNNTVGTLRMIMDIVVEKGARANNPARFISKRRIAQRELNLPSISQFAQFVAAIANGGGWCSRDCADHVSFLAFGGFRKTEAANVTFADCDFTSNQIRVRITKNGKPRSVPMIPEMKSLLQHIRAARPEAQLTDRVMRVQECQKSMDRAAKAVGIPRLTHHDLRHLFATRCIESGVDIPTVSRWLGHQDGGALAMRVYGHLRDQHSAEMAQKVTFVEPQPANAG